MFLSGVLIFNGVITEVNKLCIEMYYVDKILVELAMHFQ